MIWLGWFSILAPQQSTDIIILMLLISVTKKQLTIESGKWGRYNDRDTAETTFHEFSQISRRFPSDVPYMLFYKKINPLPTIFATESIPPVQNILEEVQKDNTAFKQELDHARRKAFFLHIFDKQREAEKNYKISFRRYNEDPDGNSGNGGFNFGHGNGIWGHGNRSVF